MAICIHMTSNEHLSIRTIPANPLSGGVLSYKQASVYLDHGVRVCQCSYSEPAAGQVPSHNSQL